MTKWKLKLIVGRLLSIPEIVDFPYCVRITRYEHDRKKTTRTPKKNTEEEEHRRRRTPKKNNMAKV